MKVWALVWEITGACGHGEGPPKDIALACEAGNPFKLRPPLPLHKTRESAVKAAESHKYSKPMIMELEVIE